MRHRTRRREIKEVAWDHLLPGSLEVKSSCCWHEPEPFLLEGSILHVSFVTADTSHTGVGRVAKAELPPSVWVLPTLSFLHTSGSRSKERRNSRWMELGAPLEQCFTTKQNSKQANPQAAGFGKLSPVWSRCQERICRQGIQLLSVDLDPGVGKAASL